jgi:hypothetical protein
MLLNEIIHYINKPIVVLFIVILFCIGYFLYTTLVGDIQTNFFLFGTVKDENDKYLPFVSFILDTWTKVIMAYLLILFSSLFHNYYITIMDQNFFSFLTNKEITKMPYTKTITYIITLIDPFIKTLLYIIEFYATATFQLQFILPQFIGSYISTLPFTLNLLEQKTFI